MSQLNWEQTRHVNAFNKLEFYFGENKPVYSKDSPFQKLVNRLIANNKKITPLSTTKGIGSQGATTDKEDLKSIIAKNGGTVCSYAAEYAEETNNNELYNIVNYSASQILYLRDAEVLGFIEGVVEAVTPLLSAPAFETYPVTEDDLNALSQDATDFNTSLGKNNNIKNNSSIASHNIDTIIKDNRAIIIRLDKLINNFKSEAPDFVEGYFKAKLILNTGVRHSGIVLIIKDKGNIVITNATITLTGKKSVKTATISNNGTYEIIKCAAGNCKLTIVAPGYETQTIAVKIIRGVVQDMSINMESNALELPEIQTA